jgi:hypothetical protein
MSEYYLICFAGDGETQREGPFASIEDAWYRNDDMGSRWYFYPGRVVVGAAGVKGRIMGVPCGMFKDWEVRAVRTLLKAVKAADEEILVAWVEGKAPLMLFPKYR